MRKITYTVLVFILFAFKAEAQSKIDAFFAPIIN
jgi:hypothetical protein